MCNSIQLTFMCELVKVLISIQIYKNAADFLIMFEKFV